MAEFLSAIFANPAVQVAIVLVIVTLLGWAAKKYAWTKTIALASVAAYEFAEEQGVLQGLKGYEKFDPFMDKLNEQIRAKFGREATPEEKGYAVKVMEGLVAKEPGK